MDIKTSDQNSTTAFDVCSAIFNTINHVLIGTASIYMTWLCVTLGLENRLTQHVFFCTIGVNN